ncbi:hypothetical protein [Actinobacillus ureae]|uniref:hypothetical protein n=1 Tax=Actinobacillus ureae TaxID=723 RepID=UPI0011C0304C|nr:hypothetical protein [Actinobacillus ureae]
MFKDWQKGQVFIYILKKWVKALEYKALTHFLPTFLSTMPKEKAWVSPSLFIFRIKRMRIIRQDAL